MMSTDPAADGLALIAPRVFVTYLELEVGLVGCGILALVSAWNAKLPKLGAWPVRVAILIGIGVLAGYVGQKETERRWRETTPQWPIMHAVLEGITRNQMMARHKSNHIQVVYVPNEKQAHRALRIKAATMAELGLEVHLCGKVEADE